MSHACAQAPGRACRLSRTFGSLAGFAGLGLLSLGVYLLADTFAHPVDAQAASLIVAALTIALAILLFSFLLKSQRVPKMFRHQTIEEFAHPGAHTSSSATPVSVHQEDLRKDLAYQGDYADRSRIRP